MESINQTEKKRSGAVYGEPSIVSCGNPNCKEVFEKTLNKVYHSKDCKDDFHRLRNKLGEKVIRQGKIRAALMENSPRLQRVVKVLSDGKPHSTRDIQTEADVCAVGTIIQELKHTKNGFDIICKQISRDRWEYTMVGGQTQLLRIA